MSGGWLLALVVLTVVSRAAGIRVSPGGNSAVALVYPDSAPQAAQTARLPDQLRSHVVPTAEDGRGRGRSADGMTPVPPRPRDRGQPPAPGRTARSAAGD